MKLATLTALVFATAALLSQTPAWAANSTTYNGSYCKPLYGSQSADFYYLNSIVNLSDASRWIACPVLLHGFGNQTGAKIYAYWIAAKSTDTLTCSAYSLHSDGTIVNNDGHSPQVQTDQATGSGWLPEFHNGDPLPQPALTLTQDDATYNLICLLPPKGKLTAIQVTENGSGE
jgi:hypothetical protein